LVYCVKKNLANPDVGKNLTFRLKPPGKISAALFNLNLFEMKLGAGEDYQFSDSRFIGSGNDPKVAAA
jgi:hypothetical protein